jgi:predicted DCC family thiol-disulfide oxidoreductase YuxK
MPIAMPMSLNSSRDTKSREQLIELSNVQDRLGQEQVEAQDTMSTRVGLLHVRKDDGGQTSADAAVRVSCS